MFRAIASSLALLSALWAGAVRAQADVVLLKSDTTAAFLMANGGDYEKLLAPWRAFFKRQNIRARELPVAQLGTLAEPAVLILPSTVALGEPERAAIRSRLAAGWSVLGTWASGARDDKGAWQGYGFIEELFACEVAADVIARKDESFLLPFGETPLTHALPAGKRMYLTQTTEPFLRVRTANAAARISDYLRDVADPGSLLGVAAFDERAGARRAFFGFAETAWDSAQADVDAMLLGTLDWLLRKPIVIKAAWPHPHEAALLLEMDTEDKFENGQVFAAQLERFRMRGTFYSLTQEAIRHPEVVKRIASRHEIAYHAEVHDGFAKLERKVQDARLQTMIRQMRSLLPDSPAPSGFRPPLEEYDANTEKALRASGLRHLAGSPDSRQDALPGFSSAEPGISPDRALVVLPRTWLDDITLLRSGQLKQSAAEKLLLASLQDTVATRGLGLLSVHSQYFYPGSVMERVMPRFLESIRKRGDVIWVAPAESIARWWRDREAVQVSVQQEPRAVRIRLSVARGPVRRVRLVLFPPNATGTPPRLEAGATKARLQKLDAYRWAIVLPELARGESELRVRF